MGWSNWWARRRLLKSISFLVDAKGYVAINKLDIARVCVLDSIRKLEKSAVNYDVEPVIGKLRRLLDILESKFSEGKNLGYIKQNFNPLADEIIRDLEIKLSEKAAYALKTSLKPA